MADLFVTLASIAPIASKETLRQGERVPGVSPLVKDGVLGERSLAAGSPYWRPSLAASLNSFIQGEVIKSASLNGNILPPLTTGLVSYWKLDGNSTDELGTNNGTDTAITYSVGNGRIIQGAGFNGTTSFINVGSTAALNLTGAMSFFAWAKNNNTTNYHMILTRGPSGGATYEFRFEITTGRLVFLNGGTSLNSGFAPTLGAWHHVGFTRTSGNVVAIYSDGVQVATTTLGAPPSLPATATFIGKRADGFFMDGAIDEPGIWNRVLDPQEIISLYNGGAGIQYPF